MFDNERKHVKSLSWLLLLAKIAKANHRTCISLRQAPFLTVGTGGFTCTNNRPSLGLIVFTDFENMMMHCMTMHAISSGCRCRADAKQATFDRQEGGVACLDPYDLLPHICAYKPWVSILVHMLCRKHDVARRV